MCQEILEHLFWTDSQAYHSADTYPTKLSKFDFKNRRGVLANQPKINALNPHMRATSVSYSATETQT